MPTNEPGAERSERVVAGQGCRPPCTSDSGTSPAVAPLRRAPNSRAERGLTRRSYRLPSARSARSRRAVKTSAWNAGATPSAVFSVSGHGADVKPRPVLDLGTAASSWCGARAGRSRPSRACSTISSIADGARIGAIVARRERCAPGRHMSVRPRRATLPLHARQSHPTQSRRNPHFTALSPSEVEAPVEVEGRGVVPVALTHRVGEADADGPAA